MTSPISPSPFSKLVLWTGWTLRRAAGNERWGSIFIRRFRRLVSQGRVDGWWPRHPYWWENLIKFPASLIYSAHRGWISGLSDKWRSPNKVGPKKNFLSFLTGLWVDNRRCASDCDTWPHSCCISSNATLVLLAMTKKEQQQQQDMRHPFWLEAQGWGKEGKKKEKKPDPRFRYDRNQCRTDSWWITRLFVSEGNKRGLSQNTRPMQTYLGSVEYTAWDESNRWEKSILYWAELMDTEKNSERRNRFTLSIPSQRT